MVTITPTAATGATIKPGPMVTVVPERAKTDEQLASFAPGSGLNAPYLADQLSAFLAHERDGVALYTALQGSRTTPRFSPSTGSPARSPSRPSRSTRRWSDSSAAAPSTSAHQRG
jgi:hypothetical protein